MDFKWKLHLAILYSNLEDVKRFHQEGADIKYENNRAAITAASHGHLKVLQWLHENGVDITAQDNEAAIWAAEGGHLEVLKWLKENGADITAQDSRAATRAAGNGRLEALRWLYENGADITAENNRTAIWAAGGEHLGCAFYVFEKGAPTTGIEDAKIIAAHGVIEAEIEKFLKENNLQSSANTRSLFYAAAYSLYETTEPDKLGDAVRKRVDKTREEIKLDPKCHAAFVTPSPTQTMEKIGFAYPKLDNVTDAVDAYVESVLLGKWLLNSGRQAKELTEEEVAEKAKELRPIAAEIIYGDRGLLGVIRYSDAWHNHPLPDDMRPLLAGRWHPIIEPHTSPYKMIFHGVEQPITITPLCSHAALKDEGDKFNPLKLAHCVGEAKYAPQCMAGKTHIISVRAGEKSLATIEIKLDEQGSKKLLVKQIEGKKGEKIPEEVTQAWNWFEGELAAGRITLNPIPEKGWGETEESKRLNTNPAIIKRIGYLPTPEQVAACHKHYTHGFNVKKEYVSSKRDERSLANIRHYALEHLFAAPGGETYEKVCERMQR